MMIYAGVFVDPGEWMCRWRRRNMKTAGGRVGSCIDQPVSDDSRSLSGVLLAPADTLLYCLFPWLVVVESLASSAGDSSSMRRTSDSRRSLPVHLQQTPVCISGLPIVVDCYGTQFTISLTAPRLNPHVVSGSIGHALKRRSLRYDF